MTKPLAVGPQKVERQSSPDFGTTSRGALILCFGILAFAVPLAAYISIILHHFYVQGSYLLDSGLQASLIWHSDAVLTPPAAFGGKSFFETHFPPFFLVLSAISWALPLSMAQYFAVVLAIGHAVPAIVVYGCLVGHYEMRSGLKPLAAAMLAIAFSFNGLALAIIRFPHVEILFVSGAMFFLWAVTLENWPAAILCFVLALSMREDAGFHLFALIFTLVVTDIAMGGGVGRRRALLGFAAAGLLYSVAALVIQRWLLGGGGSFARIYLGEPAFAHLTWTSFWVRFFGYFGYRTYVMVPGLCALIGARFMRNPYIILGYAAFLPWLILHLLADSPIAGTLSAYYAFPFMLAALWPLLAGILAPAKASPKGIIVLFGIMIATSWLGLSRQYNPGEMNIGSSLIPPSLGSQHLTDLSIDRLITGRACLGKLAVENAILALAPRAFTKADLVVPNLGQDYDTVAYFERGFDRKPSLRLIAFNHLDRHYHIAGTSLRLATRRPIESCGLGDKLTPDPDFDRSQSPNAAN